jgi:hypothetical protein
VFVLTVAKSREHRNPSIVLEVELYSNVSLYLSLGVIATGVAN